VLNEFVAVLSCSQTPPLFFCKVILPPKKINRKTVIIVNMVNMKKSWTFPEYIKDALVILPIIEVINKIISWSPMKEPTKVAYGKSYFFFKYVDVAKDPDLKKMLFKIVVIEDKANHSLFLILILKLFTIRLNFEPFRMIPSIINEENETNCKTDNSRRI